MKDTPVWVTVAVALAALAGVLFTGWQARRAAHLAADANRFGVRSDRYAAWQMHKRSVYDDLLAAVRLAQEEQTLQAQKAMVRCFDRAFLVARPGTLDELTKMWESSVPADAPASVRYHAGWAKNIEAMRRDVG